MSNVDIVRDDTVEVIVEDRDPIVVELPAQGPRGLQGVKGDKGDKGDQGIQGTQGDTGPGATVAIGTVTTGAPGSPATVTNGGTAQAAVLDFDIPQGETGAPGADGVFSQVASTTEAQAGTDDTKGMTPLKTAQAIAALAGGIPSGVVVFTILSAAPSGWLLFADQTIGNTGSGAGFADPSSQAVFNALWFFSDANCPLLTSAGAGTTRAAQTSAATAWAAGCRMSMPKALGRALAVAGAGAGLTSRALGDVVGAETVTLSSGQQASMPVSFSLSIGVTPNGFGSGAVIDDAAHDLTRVDGDLALYTVPVTGSATASGGNGSHPNMGPETFLNAMVKL